MDEGGLGLRRQHLATVLVQTDVGVEAGREHGDHQVQGVVGAVAAVPPEGGGGRGGDTFEFLNQLTHKSSHSQDKLAITPCLACSETAYSKSVFVSPPLGFALEKLTHGGEK